MAFFWEKQQSYKKSPQKESDHRCIKDIECISSPLALFSLFEFDCFEVTAI